MLSTLGMAFGSLLILMNTTAKSLSIQYYALGGGKVQLGWGGSRHPRHSECAAYIYSHSFEALNGALSHASQPHPSFTGPVEKSFHTQSASSTSTSNSIPATTHACANEEPTAVMQLMKEKLLNKSLDSRSAAPATQRVGGSQGPDVEELYLRKKRGLTPEVDAWVTGVLAQRRGATILVAHLNSGIALTHTLAACLNPRTWLNDEVINLYFALLKERNDRRVAGLPLKAHFFNSFFTVQFQGGYSYKKVETIHTHTHTHTYTHAGKELV